MDTKKLEALLTAVELGSFTRAAEVLGYTQSGLTHMMNSLENEIGLRLLDRSYSGVRLSETGKTLMPKIHRLLQVYDALNGEIKKVGHNVFLCAPSNVNVTYTEEERKVSAEMPWLKK